MSLEDIEFYPIKELPFDAYSRFLSHYSRHIDRFTPKTMEEDLKLGKINRLFFWYPNYVLELYRLADEGEDFLAYLDSYHKDNSWYFRNIFRDTFIKLDRIKNRKIKSTQLNEVKI